jgi:ABC-type antimicrobial peptide transport system permease subunit
MDSLVARALGQPRFTMTLVSAFAAVALLLAAVGIYGVLSYAVTQRTAEIGIRVALGARRSQVVGLVLRHGLALTAFAVAVGLAAALAAARLLRSQLFGVSPTDPLTFAGVPLVVAAVALLATYVPARRAAGVDPMEALRAD